MQRSPWSVWLYLGSQSLLQCQIHKNPLKIYQNQPKDRRTREPNLDAGPGANSPCDPHASHNRYAPAQWSRLLQVTCRPWERYRRLLVHAKIFAMSPESRNVLLPLVSTSDFESPIAQEDNDMMAPDDIKFNHDSLLIICIFH